jgi:YebC/PmpR family DNA-binding regulatory protein
MGRIFETRKHKMFKRYSKMAKTFTKLGKDIAMAVKQAGPDPMTNSKLRAVIQNAKAVNMPKDNVERAIKKASSKEQEDYKEVVYEGYGPFGIAILVECTTDNINRTVANIRSYFTRANGSLGTSGSLDFLFERKSVFTISPKEGMGLEDLELELIDFGVDEVFETEEGIMIYGAFTEFGAIQKWLEDHGIEIKSADFERINLADPKELSPDQEAEIIKLIDKFEEDEDVQNVYHNARLSSEA